MLGVQTRSPYWLAHQNDEVHTPIGTRLSGSGSGGGRTYADQSAIGGGGGGASGAAAWLDAQNKNREQDRIDAAKPSKATEVLYNRRNYIRGLLDSYGDTALSDENRDYQKQRGGLKEDMRRRGLGSTTVQDSLRGRLTEGHNRARSSIYENIATTKANADYGLTGDIANQYSHETDVKANFLGQAAAGSAQAKAQQNSQLIAGGASIAGLAAMAAIMM